MNNYVKIFDTTLRDGEQSPGASMNTGEKMRLAVQLEKLGVDVLEAGFPAASDGDFEAVSNIAGKLFHNAGQIFQSPAFFYKNLGRILSRGFYHFDIQTEFLSDQS